jgi:hypothetical protein
MAGIAPIRSLKEAKAILAREAPGLYIESTGEGEYKVNKIGGREATAAYDTDLTSVVGTGIEMYKKGVW